MKHLASKRDPPEARLSYKYYTGRFPELTGATGEALNKDKMLYNSKSIHYKELHFFDDMIKKINDEKEMWPGIKITDTNANQDHVKKDKDPDGAPAMEDQLLVSLRHLEASKKICLDLVQFIHIQLMK